MELFFNLITTYLSNIQETRAYCWVLLATVWSTFFHYSSHKIDSTARHWVQAPSLLGVPSTVDDPLWYPDSGATHHITNNSSAYTNKNSYDDTDTVNMGNGTGLKISAIGFAHLRYSTSNNTLVLKDLLHVPEITKNLINISKFCRDNNIFFEFHSNTCYVVHQVTKRVMLHRMLNQVVFKLWRIQILWRMLKPLLCLMLLWWFKLCSGVVYML